MGLTYLITGATRGIGLEFVKQLSEATDNKVIASARSIEKAGKLKELADTRNNVFIVELVVGDEKSTANLPKQLAKIDSGIDVFIHNAGILLDGSIDVTLNIESEIWLEHYRVNVLGAIEVYQKVYPFLAKRDTRKIAFLSSIAGSFSEFFPIPIGAYGQSKAALNYTIKHIAAELQSERFTVLATHPGVVSTDMGDESFAMFDKVISDKERLNQFKSTAITANESVTGLLEVISKATVDDNGKFFYQDGSVHEY